MEPVTHVLTGACLARCGLNRRAAYATLAMAIAAELPDIDTLWTLRGPVEGFEHHRGITHTFLGLPFEAAIVLLAVYGLHCWRVARARRREANQPAASDPNHPRATRPLTAAPVRWGTLYLFCILALLSHLLLDYTNNYGLRPFFPFNPHWYAASIVFIFDPLIFLLLVLGLIAPSIFRLVGAEVGARRQPFASRGWSVAALLLIVLLWGIRSFEHSRALQLAMSQSMEAPLSLNPPAEPLTPPPPSANQPQPDQQQQTPTPVYLSAQHALASPDPFSLFRWYTVTDFGPVYQLERADTLQQTLVATEGTYATPDRSPATLAAEASPLGRAFLDWSPMPILAVDRSAGAIAEAMAGSDIPVPTHGAVVTMRDPRFMGVLPWLSEGKSTPLTGTVVLDGQMHVILQALDGHVEPAR
ncbi:MAG TPA: metal-dependent hydrolase [Acidobacteriaceae bacterium]